MPVASGSFDVTLTPQPDDSPVGRRTIDKTFSGDLVGTSRGQMLAMQTAAGTAAYVAMEQITGTLGGRTGEFALVHRGEMGPDRQDLQVTVLEG